MIAFRLLPLLLLAACTFIGSQSGTPRYVIGAPYQTDGVWRYPREDFSANETGLAVIYDGKFGPTASGEAFDASALAAAHPTLQLPAIARVTNLENGRQVLLRINDRGPPSAARLLAVTRRTGELLGAGGAPFQVRVQVQEADSRRLAGEVPPEKPAPALAVATAPARGVQSESLAPPPGAVQAARVQSAAATPAPRIASATPAPAALPRRLPEQIWQTTPRPGQLAIDAGAFSQLAAANILRERLASLGARVTTNYDAPRDRAFIVRIGPLANLQAAEAMLRRALASAPDSRIVVE